DFQSCPFGRSGTSPLNRSAVGVSPASVARPPAADGPCRTPEPRELAEGVGFEPTWGLITPNSISSRARYDHFGTPPNVAAGRTPASGRAPRRPARRPSPPLHDATARHRGGAPGSPPPLPSHRRLRRPAAPPGPARRPRRT